MTMSSSSTKTQSAAQRAYTASHGLARSDSWKEKFRSWLGQRAKAERWQLVQHRRIEHHYFDAGGVKAMAAVHIASDSGDPGDHAEMDETVELMDEGINLHMMDVEVTTELVQDQYALFRAQHLDDFSLESQLSPAEAIELALYLEAELRREEDEARALALYEESSQLELEELQYQLEQWNMG